MAQYRYAISIVVKPSSCVTNQSPPAPRLGCGEPYHEEALQRRVEVRTRDQLLCKLEEAAQRVEHIRLTMFV